MGLITMMGAFECDVCREQQVFLIDPSMTCKNAFHLAIKTIDAHPQMSTQYKQGDGFPHGKLLCANCTQAAKAVAELDTQSQTGKRFK
jgi:hypothetical protein